MGILREIMVKLRVHYVIQELWATPNVIQELWATPNRAAPKSCYP